MATDINYPPVSMTQPNKLNTINGNYTYSIDNFYEVKNSIRDELGDINYFSDDIQLFFEKMTQNIPYIRKKKNHPPLDDEWRKRKTTQHIKKENQDSNEKTYQELKGLLNKISPNNLQSILDEINKTLENYQDKDEYEHYLDLFLNDIIKKARMEPTYCLYYVKIINGLTDKDIVNNFINDLKEQYTDVLKKLKPVDDDNDVDDNEDNDFESYDEFCISRKNKNYQKGFSQFIGELFNSHRVSINELIYYWQTIINNVNTLLNKITTKKNLFDSVKKLCIKSIEENILYLAPLVEITIEIVMKINIQSHQTEKIQNIFKDIETLNENKNIPNKTRYLLADLTDLYQKYQQNPKPKYNNYNNNNSNNSNKDKDNTKFKTVNYSQQQNNTTSNNTPSNNTKSFRSNFKLNDKNGFRRL